MTRSPSSPRFLAVTNPRQQVLGGDRAARTVANMPASPSPTPPATRRQARILATSSLVGVLLAGAAPAQAVTAPNPALRSAPCAVFYAGDSLTFSSFWDGHLYDKTLAARIGFSGEFAKPGLSVNEAGPYIVTRAARMPKVVVIALGTADLYANTSPRVFATRMAAMVTSLGPRRRIILVTIMFRRNDWDPNAAAKEAAYNAVLADLDKKNTTVTTIDWATYVAGRPWLFDANDWTHVHYTVAGSTARSNLYVATVKAACAQR